jgi:glycerophosphoryl diester phosphodiesterase
VAAIEAAGMSPEEVMVISFDEALVAEARSLRAGIPRGLIFSNPPADAISRALRLGARELMVHFESATPGLVQSAHAAGVALGAWTVNERADMERILALGVDDIGSDRPDILVELLREKGRG